MGRAREKVDGIIMVGIVVTMPVVIAQNFITNALIPPHARDFAIDASTAFCYSVAVEGALMPNVSYNFLDLPFPRIALRCALDKLTGQQREPGIFFEMVKS